MKRRTDTLIIGAGPAGISSAIALQKAGISNTVIDKSSFPRSKTCGGLVTDKTVRMLKRLVGEEADLSDVFCDESNTVEIYCGSEKQAETGIDTVLRFVRREEFDHYLVKKYIEAGGILIEGEKKYDLVLDDKCVTLADGSQIIFDHLIAADGALSKVRKMLGYKKAKQGFCIETHVDKNKVNNRDTVKIFFDVTKNGYGWCFPSGKECCIGLGGGFSKKTNYTEDLRNFLKMLGVNPDECVLKGAFVPYGDVTDQSKGPDNILLTGDAGGFVDPIYGEGLFFAILSGMEASKARINSSGNIRSEFMKLMDPHVKLIKQGTFVQKIFFKRPVHGIIMKKMYNNDSFIKYYYENMISDYKYPYSKIIKLYMKYRKSRN